MRTYLECIPCFARQALNVAQAVTDDPEVQQAVMRKVLREITEMDLSLSPPAMGQFIHRVVRQTTGNSDPYHEIKETFNQLALSMYPRFKRRVEESADPLEMATRLAIAGNIIDFGAKHSLTKEDVSRTLAEALETPLPPEPLGTFRREIADAASILYLGDNAGEIVFDRLLIEKLPRERTTFVVRGSPVINDATLRDAEQVGVAGLVEVIDNGSDAPGTIIEDCSAEFRDRFAEADLIIAKGQGNYETLNETDLPIFYLLKVKCPVIARDIGCPVGSALLVDGRKCAGRAKR